MNRVRLITLGVMSRSSGAFSQLSGRQQRREVKRMERMFSANHPTVASLKRFFKEKA